MNKNTVIGITLMGLVLIGFSVFNSNEMRKQQEVRRVQDSIAAVRAAEYAEEMAKIKADSIAFAEQFPDSVQTVETYSSTYSNEFLEAAHRSESSVIALENDKLKVKLTTRGAQPYSVQVKDYYTCDSTDLFIMKEGESVFGISLYTSQYVNTDDFTFEVVSSTDSSAVMRLYFSENSYVEHIYTLRADSYMVDFDFRLVGMQGQMPRNANSCDMSWNLNIPRMERGYKNEKAYSSIYFRYPGEDGVESLGQRKDNAEKNVTTSVNWFAFQQQFFSAIMVADSNFSSANLSFKFFTENDAARNLMHCEAKTSFPLVASPDVTNHFKFYFGPNHFKTLKSYDYRFEKIIPLGGWLVGWINRIIIIPFFDLLNGMVSSYGIIILIMTILLKLLVSPLTIKSYMSSAKMNVLKPEVDKINAKYPRQEDAMKKQQEIMELYRKADVSLMGGCLPIFLQFPVLWAMFRFFPASFELRQQSFLWAKDLSTYDSILNFGFNIPLYGNHVSLFALLVGISMFVYSKMTSKQMADNPQMASMRFMTLYFMPVMMLFICNNLSSALSYYYLLSNIFMMAQTWIIRKYFVDEAKILKKIQERSAKNAAKPKSRFQQRLEAMQKAQQQALREQQKRR